MTRRVFITERLFPECKAVGQILHSNPCLKVEARPHCAVQHSDTPTPTVLGEIECSEKQMESYLFEVPHCLEMIGTQPDGVWVKYRHLKGKLTV